MITDKGKNIIAKYMLGQAPEYAAYLAVGVGAQPWFPSDDNDRRSMQFEAFRVPVLSRGLVNDTISLEVTVRDGDGSSVRIATDTPNGLMINDSVTVTFSDPGKSDWNETLTVTSIDDSYSFYASSTQSGSWAPALNDTATLTYVRERLIFKAQLPPDQRYLMTEVGVYPAANNQLALNYDSKPLVGFLSSEGWTLYSGGDSDVELVSASLADEFGYLNLPSTAFYINSDNPVFLDPDRANNQEPPRYLNQALVVEGDLTSFDNDTMAISGDVQSVYRPNISWDFGKNSAYDIIKVAFSIIRDSPTAPWPAKTRLRMDITDATTGVVGTLSRMFTRAELEGLYTVWESYIGDIIPNGMPFSLSRISTIRLYAQTLDDGDAWDGSCICFDGIRLDNENTENPLYGLVAYSVIGRDDFSYPVDKLENSQGYLEYRMGVAIT